MATAAASVANSLQDGKLHLLLAASGSVAAIKMPLIISALAHHPNLSIRVILTRNAARFLAGQSAEQPDIESLASLPHVDAVYRDEDEVSEPWKRGAAILHIELRRWAHLLVIAPASANLLAKVCHGLCDDLLSTTVRAWDTDGSIDGPFRGRAKRILLATAMNTAMWRHPVTARQIRLLEEEWGVKPGGSGWFEVLKPKQKTLACGDTGPGAMVEWQDLVELIEARLGVNME